MARTMKLVQATLLLFVYLCPNADGLPEVIRVGGLFDTSDTIQEVAFKYAINRINGDRTILTRSRLSAQVEPIAPQDSFHASKRVCHLLKSGVAAIFGPQSSPTASHVQSICDAMAVPHIETRWDFRQRIGPDKYLINLYPHPSCLSKAYVDLVVAFKWKTFTILYEDNDGLVRLQELLKAPSSSDFKITVRQLPQNKDYRSLLKELKKKLEYRIVLDCATENIMDIFHQALQVGMIGDTSQYILTSLDVHTLNLEEYAHGGANISAFRLIDPEKEEVKQIFNDWKKMNMIPSRRGGFRDQIPKDPLNPNMTSIKTETALIYDAVHLFAQALHQQDSVRPIDIKQLNCDGTEKAEHGSNIITHMKVMGLTGLTGRIQFDSMGFRKHFTLELVEVWPDGYNKVGTWSDDKLTITRNFTQLEAKLDEDISKKLFRIVTKQGDPYCSKKPDYDVLHESDGLEGYAIDLAHEIAKLANFNYTIHLVEDGQHGSYFEANDSWNGMIQELLTQKADLAIGDLTITRQREECVDFTTPFLDLGIGILYKKPKSKKADLFSFLKPLGPDVWIYMAAAYMGVSILMFVLARFSPYEWNNPHPCNDDPDELENQFNMLNSLWFTIGSLMQQGSDLAPKAVSTRMVAGIWWFFTLIMISSYTANLAAFLTVERLDSPIESVDDLANQNKIKYGTMDQGATKNFFEKSTHPTYKRMWMNMESARPSIFVKSNEEGTARVLKADGHYAFFMESTSIDYQMELNCDLDKVGSPLDTKGYGVGMPPHFPYKDKINWAVLTLAERGMLTELKNRWWKENPKSQHCQKSASKAGVEANELGMANVGGVFVVLLGGMAMSCIVAVCEFVWKSRKMAMEEKSSLWSEMAQELKFMMQFRVNTKPVKKPEAAEALVNKLRSRFDLYDMK